MTVLEYTNKGSRESNQDYLKSCSLNEGAAIYVVSDGMGGYAHGDVAAKIVSESVIDFVAEHINKMTPGQMLTSAFEFANESLNLKRLSLNVKEMGCVLVTLLIINDMAYMAWLGDSRIYVFRNGKEAYQTVDHSMITELSKIKTLSLEDIEKYSSIVTRAIMGNDENVKPSLMKTEVKKGDVFLLCSDGLYKQWPIQELPLLSDDEITSRLDSHFNIMDDNYSLIKVTI